ncbi:MAG: hypothetical protein IPH52_07530 [Leptospiraceae bacterium]|nr:hypothetical protein [Leptospiraceae bacterium]
MIDELVKDVYAKFGLAYYLTECIHRNLCNIFTFSSFESSEHIVNGRIEEKLNYSFYKTFNQIYIETKKDLPDEIKNQMDIAVKKRNYLAHHFWFEKVNYLFNEDKIVILLDELENDYINFFESIDSQLDTTANSLASKLNLPDAILQESLNEILNGKNWDEIQTQRKLNTKELLIAVWDVKVNNGVSLIFELADKTFWQLTDIGLGWTEFKEISDTWIRNNSITPHLPAHIEPRPKNIKPWDYELEINSKILWVKLSEKEKKIKWGLKEKIN